jgi:transglutaminase-like putative cysteine protease
VIYGVRHRTTYTYDAPVAFARCVLRLTPLTSPAQTLEQISIAVTPEPSRTDPRTDPFAQGSLVLVIEKSHSKLVIEASSTVDLHAPAVEGPAASPSWEAVRGLGFQSRDIGAESPATFLYPTARTPMIPAVTDYARASFPAGRPVLEAAGELMSRIREDFTYDPKATDAYTPPQQAFALRHGVCQDFANVMICGLRGLGLPAAYVSGYLRTAPPPGRPRLEGADATHAWVRLWCGEERGWIGLDPTNAIYVENDHITLTVGRDASDTAPIDGVLLGSGDQALKVEVDVVPLDETSAPRPFVASRVGQA